MTKNILITGGEEEYSDEDIKILVKNKKKIFIIDNLSTPFKKLINKKAKFYLDNINTKKIREIIINNKIDSIIHLAGSLIIGVGEKYPKRYYRNNVLGTKSIISACENTMVKNLIFSSTAAVYKDNQKIVHENSHIKPKSVYGKTKSKAEKVIISNCKKINLNYAIYCSPGHFMGFKPKISSKLCFGNTFFSKLTPVVKIYGFVYF